MFMPHLNMTFRLCAMAAVRTWSELVEFAQRHGFTEAALRKAIQDKGVSSATVTNWKNRNRTLPDAKYPLIADAIGTTIDDLIGRRSVKSRNIESCEGILRRLYI